MNPPDIIGHRILSLRYHHITWNQQGLQEFHSYLQLSNGEICTIPVWPIAEPTELIANKEELVRRFETGSLLKKAISHKIIGNKITDIYFQQGKGLFAKPAFLELENGYYLSEENYTSHVASLILLEKGYFLLERGFKSYLKEIKGK